MEESTGSIARYSYNSALKTQNSALRCGWSGREDLNLRHPAPKAGALPGCATPRLEHLEFHLS